MKPKIKEKWIAALQSDEYAQGKFQLRTNDGFCCLGVLCDLYIKEHSNTQWSDSVSYKETLDDIKPYEATPPSYVSKWAGLDDIDMRLLSNQNDGEWYTNQNDNSSGRHQPMTFQEIVDQIITPFL